MNEQDLNKGYLSNINNVKGQIENQIKDKERQIVLKKEGRKAVVTFSG